MTRASPRSVDAPAGARMRLTRELLSPYRGWIVIILLAMLAETAMSLAAPWSLKVILDNVLGTHKAPEWLAPFRGSLLGAHKMEVAGGGGNGSHRRAEHSRELHRQLPYRAMTQFC